MHTLGAALTSGFEVWSSDCILPVVPMFHVNCWGLPYVAAMAGAKLVFTGSHVDAESLLEAFAQEHVTLRERTAKAAVLRICKCSQFWGPHICKIAYKQSLFNQAFSNGLVATARALG